MNSWADGQNTLKIANDAEVADQALDGITSIELHFPKFTDGRAYSQATALRRRKGFTGDIRATGDVLVDQLLQMQRCGFSSAVLREDQSLDIAMAQFAQYGGFYQGDSGNCLNSFPFRGKQIRLLPPLGEGGDGGMSATDI
jgi:uncharacterized protein (DUF934 family)